MPRGSDGRRVTARSKGEIERSFRTVKEAPEKMLARQNCVFISKPIVLMVDEAHDLHHYTLTGPKRLVEIVADSDGKFSALLAGHPTRWRASSAASVNTSSGCSPPARPTTAKSMLFSIQPQWICWHRGCARRCRSSST
jgi:hypothetical protein